MLSTCGGGLPCYTQPTIVWDVATGQEMLKYQGHDNNVKAAAFSPDGQFVATAGGDRSSIDFRELAGERSDVLSGTGASVMVAGFSLDGKSIGWGYTNKHCINSPSEPFAYFLKIPAFSEMLEAPQRIESPNPLATDNRNQPPKSGVDEDCSEPSQVELAKNSGTQQFSRRITAFGSYSLSLPNAADKNTVADGSSILELKKGSEVVARIERDITSGFTHSAFGFSHDGKKIISGGGGGLLYVFDRAEIELAALKAYPSAEHRLADIVWL